MLNLFHFSRIESLFAKCSNVRRIRRIVAKVNGEKKKKKKKKSLKQKMENPRFRVNHSFTRWKPLVHRRTRIKLRGSSLLFESRCSAIKVKSCRVFRDRSAFKRISCSRSMVHTFRSDGQSAETRWFLGNSNKKRRGEKKNYNPFHRRKRDFLP